MKQNDIDATRECIAVRWYPNWQSEGGKTYPQGDCKLCELYHHTQNGRCGECPIYLKTGKLECLGTPYWDWIRALSFNSAKGSKGAAESEIHFLLSLLPEDEQWAETNDGWVVYLRWAT